MRNIKLIWTYFVNGFAAMLAALGGLRHGTGADLLDVGEAHIRDVFTVNGGTVSLSFSCATKASPHMIAAVSSKTDDST